MSDKEKLEKLEQDLTREMVLLMMQELDWGDYFEVADLMLGDSNSRLVELKRLVHQVYGV